jgi:hypothetical protein
MQPGAVLGCEKRSGSGFVLHCGTHSKTENRDTKRIQIPRDLV